MTYIPIRQGHIATLANGEPAWTRGGFVTKTMIAEHGGSYQAARLAMQRKVEG